MKIGLVGLPNVGKSTLFNALTKAGVPAENRPFCTTDPNLGIVNLPDVRLDRLCEMYDTLSRVPATVEFVDIAGLVKGAGKGEGLGNQFLGHIRNVAAVLHVVRCFEDDNITHVEGRVSPCEDVETINYELIFADLEIVEKRLAHASKSAKNSKDALWEAETLTRARDALLSEQFLSEAFSASGEAEEREYLTSLGMLTAKPFLFIANVAEEDIAGDPPLLKELREYLETRFPNAPLLVVSARIEAEIVQLESPQEIEEYFAELGLECSGLDQVIRAGYSALDLITFFTAGHKECRAWSIERGTRAPQAAGKIHSDFERGFIRAEVTKYDKLVEAGSDVRAKEMAFTRVEGKEYVVQDGDVVFFRFAV